jgi:predicted lipoprotein with Yx(FWY)xxD motif
MLIVGMTALVLPAALPLISQSTGNAGAPQAAPHREVTSPEISSPAGRVLADSNGRLFYLYTRDVHDRSRCTGDCLSDWPAVDSTGSPRAGASVDAGKISRTASGQVTYNGHPLYDDTADTAPGRHTGEGAHVDGGRFYLVTTSGKALKPANCASPESLCGTASS